MRISRGMRALLATTSLVALVPAARAQVNTPPSTTAAQGTADQPVSAETTTGAAAAGDQATLQSAGPESSDGDVIVTAQRREQALRDVPVAISVVSSEALLKSNFTAITDLQFLSPGVNYNANFGGGFNVRGVGTQSLSITAEQSVALVIDDVVQGLPEVSFAGPSYQTLGDIERIEVLKGPQGTLFGKNSSAGVIQIITKNPVLGRTSVDGYVSYAKKNEVNANANVNLPLGENAALRVSGTYQRRDGFVPNKFDGTDRWGYERFGIRGKLLWRPTDTLKVLLEAEYRNLKDNANGLWTLRTCGSGSGTFNPCAELAKYGIVASERNLDVAVEGPSFTRQYATNLSGRIDYDLGSATITSITAYRYLKQPIGIDTDATPRPVYSVNQNTSGGEQFTQELRINGQASILDYTVGGFYYNATPYQRGIVGGTLGVLPDNSPNLVTLSSIGPLAQSGAGNDIRAKVESFAAFGQLEAEVVNGLTLIAGGRYTNDRVQQRIDYFLAPGICGRAFLAGGPCISVTLPTSTPTAVVKADKFTYKFTAKYDVTPDINVYATYATGYKGPMISNPGNQPQLLVRPETSVSYEIGLKGVFFDRKVSFNIDLFKVDYDNFQAQQRVGVSPVFFYTTTNAGGLQTKGVEGDVSWRVTPELTLSANASYIPSKFTEFSVQCYDRYTNPATPVGQCNYLAPGVPAGAPFQFNAAGYPLIYSPRWNAGGTVDYERDLNDRLQLTAHASYVYRSSVYGIVADPNSIVDGYGLLNGEIGVGAPDGRWRVSVFARNLLDTYFVAGIFRTPLDAGSYNSTPLSTIGYSNIPALDSSRSIGGKLSFSF